MNLSSKKLLALEWRWQDKEYVAHSMPFTFYLTHTEKEKGVWPFKSREEKYTLSIYYGIQQLHITDDAERLYHDVVRKRQNKRLSDKERAANELEERFG